MKNLRLWIVALVAYLTAVLRFERPDVGQESAVALHGSLFIFTILAVLLVLGWPRLARLPAIVSLVGLNSLYLLSRLALGIPLLGGINPYLAITELALLGGAIWLAHRVANTLYEIENTVETLSFLGSNDRVHQLEDVLEQIHTEVSRSRRHQHPLSVVVVEPEAEQTAGTLSHMLPDLQRTMMRRYMSASIAQVISQALRRTDLLIEERECERFIIFSPETNSINSTILAERVRQIVTKRLGVSVACGAASFPEEALTFEELVQQAEANLKSPAPVEVRSEVRSLVTGEAERRT